MNPPKATAHERPPGRTSAAGWGFGPVTVFLTVLALPASSAAQSSVTPGSAAQSSESGRSSASQGAPPGVPNASAHRRVQAERRYRFAQTYLGFGAAVAPVTGTYTPADGEATVELPVLVAPRLVLGGLHFWGHIDLYGGFSPTWFQAGREDDRTRLTIGVETGIKVYPWALSPGTVRPFAGLAWAPNTFERGDGPLVTMHQMPVMGGVAYRSGLFILEWGASLHLLGDSDYPTGRDPSQRARIDPNIVETWLGIRFEFDTTEGYIDRAASGALEREYRRRKAKGRLGGFEVAFGPSSGLPVTDSRFHGEGAFLSGLRRPTFATDVAIGYLWPEIHDGLDLAVRINHRFFDSADEGYRRRHDYERHSVSLDGLLFFANYLGFIPFVGVGVAAEHLAFSTEDELSASTGHWTTWTVGGSILLGWDIRPSRTSEWMLRTNLRYSPGLGLNVPTGEVRYDYVELNLFQLVLYPERLF